MSSATLYYDFEINDKTVEFQVDATFSPSVAANFSGHPDNWAPAEGGDLDEMIVSHVHAHTKDGKTTHTTELCHENLLFELLAQENGWTLAKAESEVEQKCLENAEADEPDYPEYEPDEDW